MWHGQILKELRTIHQQGPFSPNSYLLHTMSWNIMTLWIINLVGVLHKDQGFILKILFYVKNEKQRTSIWGLLAFNNPPDKNLQLLTICVFINLDNKNSHESNRLEQSIHKNRDRLIVTTISNQKDKYRKGNFLKKPLLHYDSGGSQKFHCSMELEFDIFSCNACSCKRNPWLLKKQNIFVTEHLFLMDSSLHLQSTRKP